MLYYNEPAFQQCARECTSDAVAPSYVPNVLGALLLLLWSGTFSGLTLGLLTLSLEGLEILVSSGSGDEQRWARKIMPLRRRGNLLLCTLLLGNTLVNAMIAIITADMTSGLVGGLISTAMIVIFGEIIPQAVCSRHGLRIGAASTWLVRPLILLFLPVTWPVSKVLDYTLGTEMRTYYNRLQLDKLLEIQMEDQAITMQDQRILSSALTFGAKHADGIMTPIKDVFMISVTDVLDFDRLKAIYTSGYTRIPVYHNRTDTIVGIIFTKDLILLDPNDEIPVASILPFCSRAVNAAPRSTLLPKLLSEMQASHSHLYFVTDGLANFKRRLPRVEKVVGIVTMEDLLEELIRVEIIDDSDVVTDNISKKKVAAAQRRVQRRLEFFEMLQRRDEMLLMDRQGNARATADEVRALVSFLSSQIAIFRPPAMSSAALRRLVLRCSVCSIEQEELDAGRYVYVRGVPASFACLLLHGRLQIRAGNEGFASEMGPWTPIAMQALTDVSYKPDFTARVECGAPPIARLPNPAPNPPPTAPFPPPPFPQPRQVRLANTHHLPIRPCRRHRPGGASARPSVPQRLPPRGGSLRPGRSPGRSPGCALRLSARLWRPGGRGRLADLRRVRRPPAHPRCPRPRECGQLAAQRRRRDLDGDPAAAARGPARDGDRPGAR